MSFFVDPDIRKANTLDVSFYLESKNFEASKTKIFQNNFQWLVSLEALPPGILSYPLTYLDGFLDIPLLLTKEANEQIHCLSNVCTHRGSLICTHPNKSPKLVCPYHGRRFNAQGKFEHMPEFSDAVNFPRIEDNLNEFRLETYKNLLFTCLKGDTDFAPIRQMLDERMFFFPLESCRFDATRSKDYLVHAHWALYCENYLEGFHIPFVHPSLNKVLSYKEYANILYPMGTLQIGYSDTDTEIFDLPKESPDYGKKVAAYYYFIFPNLMLNFYPWGLSLNIIKPISPTKTRVKFLSFVLDSEKIEDSAGASLDLVEREDEMVVESVQKGLMSPFYPGGRFSPTKEVGVHHFQRFIADCMNK